MEIVPSIDLKDGKCIRLFRGLEGTEKIYFDDPIKLAKVWVSFNAKRLHIVDLDKAWGTGNNTKIIESIINEVKNKIKIQIGGGIRKIEEITTFFREGADRIILGTLAVKEPKLISEFSNQFGNEKIMVAVDYRKNKIEINGWKTKTNLDPFKLAKKMINNGAGYILFSSIEGDGTFQGPDLHNIEQLTKLVNPNRIYVAGGIRSEMDIKDLKKFNLKGIIIGKAFYENRIPFSIVK